MSACGIIPREPKNHLITETRELKKRNDKFKCVTHTPVSELQGSLNKSVRRHFESLHQALAKMFEPEHVQVDVARQLVGQFQARLGHFATLQVLKKITSKPGPRSGC